MISAFNLSMMMRGVPAGAMMPNHELKSYFGYPNSAMVGTLGKFLNLLVVVTASAHNLPSLM